MKIAAVLLTLGVLGAGVLAYPLLAGQQPDPAGGSDPRPVVQRPDPGRGAPPGKRQIDDDNEIGPLPSLSKEKVKALLQGAAVGEKMKALLEARFDAARSEVDARWKRWVAGRTDLDRLVAASLRLLEAERELSTRKAEQIVALENQYQRMAQVEKISKAKVDVGKDPVDELFQARFYRLQAEILLERAKAP
jgi:hypothetical protein